MKLLCPVGIDGRACGEAAAGIKTGEVLFGTCEKQRVGE